MDGTAGHGAGTPSVDEVVSDELEVLRNKEHEDQPMAGKKAQTSAEAALVNSSILIHTSVVVSRVTSRKGTRLTD